MSVPNHSTQYKEIISINDDFDLDKIAQSGQCFRWNKTGERSYRIIAGEACLNISSLKNNQYGIDCKESTFDKFWRKYFDLQEDYQNIRKCIDPICDPFLWEAMEHEKGIRILRQDPWEMLITFIISQNKNIPAIRRSVELLSKSYGRKLVDSNGQEYYGFPDPSVVAELSKKHLMNCQLGYRCKYVHAAAEAVLCGDINLTDLEKADEETTISMLTELYGVGVKVANCVSLFGLHHLNAFPIDVWIKRIMTEQYPKGYPFERYSPYNGIYQQFMFAWYRHQGDKNKY